MAKTPFKLRSGNNPAFKMMSVSPLKTDPRVKWDNMTSKEMARPVDEPEEGMTEAQLIEYNERLDMAEKDEGTTEATEKTQKKFVRGAKGNVFKYKTGDNPPVFTEEEMNILRKDPRANIKTRSGKVDYPATDIRRQRDWGGTHSLTKTIADTIKTFKK